MVSTASLRPPALPTRSRTTDEIPRATAARPHVAPAARILGRADPHLDGILRAPRRRGGDRLSVRRARLGGEAVSASRSYDIVIIGSGAGGGTVAQELAPLVRDDVRILVLEKGPRFADQEFTGRELEMADALYQDGGAFLTRDGTMTLAFASACRGSSLCNLGCPNQAKQGTNRVQLPRAERAGVEVVTRAEVWCIYPDPALTVRVSQKAAGTKGAPSEWAPGDYAVRARIVVAAAGAIGTSALLLRSPLPAPRSLGHGFTCHPALILVAEHARPITNDVGHPKSYFVDHGASERFVLETCMYFPFVTAKSLTGFGATHSAIMHAFPRLQMILILACDHVASGNRIAVTRTGSPIVHYRFTPETIDGLVRGTRAAARIFFAAGARRVHAPADPPPLETADADRLEERVTARHFRPGMLAVSAAHLMGGCGMGRTAADSVTDAWGRVHGLPWLRVADASLFPDSLEINPYLTIMGLADRVAEGVRRDLPVVRD